MTTLELHLDDDMKSFVEQQSLIEGHSSPEAYIEALLAMQRMRLQADRITPLLVAAIEEDPNPRVIDDQFWVELRTQILERASRQPQS